MSTDTEWPTVRFERKNTDDRLIVFVQVPKSAGSAMVSVLRQMWPCPEQPATKPGWNYRGMICGRGHRMWKVDPPLDKFDKDEIQMRAFIEKVNAKIDEISWIAGHFHYGIHRHLKRECRYITIVRDPVERVVSLEAHIRRTPGDPIHQLWKAKYNLNLFLALEAGEFRVCNDATRMLDKGEYEYIDKSDLPLGTDPSNGNENPPGSERILNDEEIKFVASYNREDMELYHATRGKEIAPASLLG